MTKRKDGGTDRTVYHRKSDDKWIDKRNDADRGFAFDTQKDAVKSAREKLGNAGGGDVAIKGEDGKIRQKDTVPPGSDPNPPRDKK